MDTTKQKVAWRDLGDRFPVAGVMLSYDTEGHDTGERSATHLNVTYKRNQAVDRQEALYECAHGRVRVAITMLGDARLAPEMAPRLALGLHAWGLDCSCYHADWEAHLGEPASGRSLAAARWWINELRDARLFASLEVKWEAREPAARSWYLRRSVRGSVKAA